MRVKMFDLLMPAAVAGAICSTVIAFHTPHPLLASCPKCTPDGCTSQLEPGETITKIGSAPIKACIDADGDGMGHCCSVTQVHYQTKRFESGLGDVYGDCYKTLCASGTIVTPLIVCSHPYVNPTGPSSLTSLSASANNVPVQACSKP